jgi:hypothetical protein
MGLPADSLQTVVPIGEKPFPAQVTSIDVQWNITFQTNDDSRIIAASDVVYWGAYRDSYQSTQIVLVDGSLISAELLEVGQETLTIDGEICGRIEIPISRVRGVVFDAPVDSLLRDRLLDRVRSSQGVSDQLILDNGEVANGVLQGLREAVDSMGVREPVLLFSADGRELEISLERTVAVVFNPALAEVPKETNRHVMMGFGDGSLLDVASVGKNGPYTQLGLVCAVQLDVDPYVIRDDLTYLFSFNDRVRYVSDLTTLNYKHIPMLDTSWPLARNRSTTGGQLRWADHVHIKGLGMHSASTVACNLSGQYRQFQAELAIDARSGLQGSVVFRVFLYDSSGKRTRAFESPVVHGGDKPIAMAVDVSGARAMALIVDFAERGDVLDHANWLDARLIK